MELVSPRRRVLGGAALVWSYTLGAATLGLLAWALRHWRPLLLTLYGPALLFVAYIWLVPESIRWLVARGRSREAARLVQRAAAVNRVQLSESLQEKLASWHTEICTEEATAASDEAEKEDSEGATFLLRDVLGSRTLLLRLAICSYMALATTLVYSGLSLNSVSLAGTTDRYLNFVLVVLVEAPSYLLSWVGMNRLGRRITLGIALLVSSVACLLHPFVPRGADWAELPLYLTGKLAGTCAVDTLNLINIEVFPTRTRASLISICNMVGRIGSMIAPQTPLLTAYSPALPMALFGGAALVASALSLLLPETANRTLPNSVRDAETLGAVEELRTAHEEQPGDSAEEAL